ncbi:MAG: alpha/beta hydrolase-fold protein [Chthoniobacter sp.]|nr:alpha/beta hydrolase-fold protein [Chthoniobacter sp.]
MNREYHKWHSPALGREMELLVFGTGGPRMLVFPSRKARFFEYEDRGMIHSLRHRLEAGRIQLFCVDGLDEESLYCFEKSPEQRVERHLQYERYILDEVLPFSAKLNPKTPLIAHGCSLGAYHAVTMALRHPQHFQRALAFSGRYDLTLHTSHYHSLFHGFYSDALREIVPSHFVPLLTDRKRLKAIRRVRFTFVVGDEDPFYENNVELCVALAKKEIKYELHAWCGQAHRFRYWRQMIRIYL